MAQNSDALQEPSMDELLASIREIIEENTGIPPQEGAPARNANGAQNRTPPMDGAGRYEAAMPNLKQDIFVRNDNKPASGPNGRPLYGAPHPNNAGGAGGNAPVYSDSRDNMAGQNNGQMMGGRPPAGAYPGTGGYGQTPNGRPMREAPQSQPRAPQPEGPQDMRRPERSDMRAAQDARPVQDSMNALAERIGLRRSAAPAPAYNAPNAPAPNNSAPQGRPARAERPAPAAPAGYNAPVNAVPPQNGNFSPAATPAAAAQAGRSSGGASYPQPQRGNYGYNESSRNESGRPQRTEENEGQNAPRFNPAAMAGYRREREAAERQQPQQPYEAESRSGRPGFAAADIMPAAQPQNAERTGVADWLDSADAGGNEPAKLSPAAAYAASELKKAFPAEVEHSAENLLRPFITQWLDEHFRELFEKVLREEVQRFIQSMRRNE